MIPTFKLRTAFTPCVVSGEENDRRKERLVEFTSIIKDAIEIATSSKNDAASDQEWKSDFATNGTALLKVVKITCRVVFEKSGSNDRSAKKVGQTTADQITSSMRWLFSGSTRWKMATVQRWCVR